MGRLLIVDDEPNLRRVLGSDLRLDGHKIEEADGVRSAVSLLAENEYDVVITDQKMPDGDGLKVLTVARESDPTVAVIFLTAVPTIEHRQRQTQRREHAGSRERPGQPRDGRVQMTEHPWDVDQHQPH